MEVIDGLKEIHGTVSCHMYACYHFSWQVGGSINRSGDLFLLLPACEVEWSHSAVILSVNIGPGLEQIGDVRETGLLTGGVVQGRPPQPENIVIVNMARSAHVPIMSPVSTVQYPHRV